MDLELQLRDSLVLEDTSDDFIAKVMARVDSSRVIDIRTRRRSRFIVLGVLAVVGAAAAMQALQLSGWRGHAPQHVIADPLAADKDVPAIHSRPSEEIAVNPFVAPAAPARVPVDEPRRYTVLVMPTVDQSRSPGAKTVIEAFQAALIGELRRMPDLVLVDSGTASAERKAKADYLLTVTALETRTLTRTLSSGAVEVISILNGNSRSSLGTHIRAASAQQAQSWPVEVIVEDVQDPSFYAIASLIGGDGALTGESCRQSSDGNPARHIGSRSQSPSSCSSKAQMAAALTHYMRPKDPAALQRQLVAQLRDASSNEGDRLSALANLGSLQKSGSALDDAGISAVVDFIAGRAPLGRVDGWRNVRSWKEPRLVAPLLDALLQDADEKVRLELLALLAPNHREDQRVLAAIETAARSDPSQTVRMAARRTLYGDAEWNSYVISALQDASLSYEERLKPLLALSPWQDQSSIIVNDEGITKLLVRLVREGSSDPSRVQAAAGVLGLLNNVDSPAVLDLQIELLQDSDRFDKLGARGMLLALQASSGLMRHRDEPRVRRVLDEIVAGGGNTMLWTMIEQQLRDSPAPR